MDSISHLNKLTASLGLPPIEVTPADILTAAMFEAMALVEAGKLEMARHSLKLALERTEPKKAAT